MALKGKLMGLAHLPLDADLLAAVGRVTIRHGFLDWTLNRTIKTLTGMTPEQADFAFATEGSSSLRRKALHIAATKFEKRSATYKELKKLVDRCESVTKERNRYTHNLWLTIEGKAVLLDLQAKDQRPPLPTAKQLNDLAEKIHALSEEINAARDKHGFLFAALKKAREEKKSARPPESGDSHEKRSDGSSSSA